MHCLTWPATSWIEELLCSDESHVRTKSSMAHSTCSGLRSDYRLSGMLKVAHGTRNVEGKRNKNRTSGY
jgi:hypothetical protein